VWLNNSNRVKTKAVAYERRMPPSQLSVVVC
jgi:hypothetical protein